MELSPSQTLDYFFPDSPILVGKNSQVLPFLNMEGFPNISCAFRENMKQEFGLQCQTPKRLGALDQGRC